MPLFLVFERPGKHLVGLVLLGPFHLDCIFQGVIQLPGLAVNHQAG